MRTLVVGLAIVGCIAVLGGCATNRVDGMAVALGGDTTVAGLAMTYGPSGEKPRAQPAAIFIRNSDGGRADKLAGNAMADIQEYWKTALPQHLDTRFRTIHKLMSYDSTRDAISICGTNTLGLSNAFYCAENDTIAWDRKRLFPALTKRFGPIAPVTVLAHESGHAVAHRLGMSPNSPTILQEQQADCYTGAFFRHVAEGKSEHFQVSTTDGLNSVMRTLFHIRDPAGQAHFTNNEAHGSAFDRIAAFQKGFSAGPRQCAQMTPETIQHRITEFKFWKDSQKQSLAVHSDNIRAVEANLREVFADFNTPRSPTPRISTSASTCPPTGAATYCPHTNTVHADLGKLSGLARKHGDFAAYAALASRYTLALTDGEASLTGSAAAARTSCLVGAWSGSQLEDPLGKRNPKGSLRLAPGDLDEGVGALLRPNTLIAADVAGDSVGSGFARVYAFQAGFTAEQPEACLDRYSG